MVIRVERPAWSRDGPVWRFYAAGRFLGSWVPATGWYFMPRHRARSDDEWEVVAAFSAFLRTGLRWTSYGYHGPADWDWRRSPPHPEQAP